LKQGSGFDVRDGFGLFGPGELAIEPLVIEEAGFCYATNSMATAASAPEGAEIVTLSEAEILEKIARGEAVSEEIVRAEVVAALRRVTQP